MTFHLDSRWEDSVHPSVSVGRSIHRSARLSHFTFLWFLRFSAPAQMIKMPQIWPLPTRTRLGKPCIRPCSYYDAHSGNLWMERFSNTKRKTKEPQNMQYLCWVCNCIVSRCAPKNERSAKWDRSLISSRNPRLIRTRKNSEVRFRILDFLFLFVCFFQLLIFFLRARGGQASSMLYSQLWMHLNAIKDFKKKK